MSDYRKLFDVPTTTFTDEQFDSLALLMSRRAKKYPDAARTGNSWFSWVLKTFGFQLDKVWGGIDDGVTIKPITVPSGFTYFGQMLIHDISKASGSDRHVRKDLPWNFQGNPGYLSGLTNGHAANFNLEVIYGKTPSAAVCSYSDDPDHLPYLRLGDTTPSGPGKSTDSRSFPCDLPRKEHSQEAEIPDTRNDENLIVAQLLLAFMKFHNAIVFCLHNSGAYVDAEGALRKEDLFSDARRLNIRYYQTIILKDFLPRLVDPATIEAALRRIDTADSVYQPANERFIPAEFSTAAFRFGHSMIRDSYEFNTFHKAKMDDGRNTAADVSDLQTLTGLGRFGTRTTPTLPSGWIIDWTLFFNFDNPEMNIARPIDTVLPTALLMLRPLSGLGGRSSSLAAFDLFRAQACGVSSGQQILRDCIRTTPLTKTEIGKIILDKRVSKFAMLLPGEEDDIKNAVADDFSGETPLWFYVLAEAESRQDKTLGDLGARIVLDTVLQLLVNSDYSTIKNDSWVGAEFLLVLGPPSMVNMLSFIKNIRDRHPDEIYPICSHFDELNPIGSGRTPA